jgi:hypothetical protein
MTLATFSTVPALLAAVATAQPGETLKLAPGDYGSSKIAGVHAACAQSAPPCVTVDLSGATFATLDIVDSSGIVLVGPTSRDSTWYGFTFARASFITLQGWKCEGGALAACVGIGTDSHDIVVQDGSAHGHTGDCIDMNSVQHVLVKNNTCLDNVVTPKSPHPDVVQMWTIKRDGACVPTTDVTVTDNYGRGPTQGIDTFGTKADCPIERVIIHHNRIETIGGYWCYGLVSAVDSKLEDNVCRSIGDKRSAGIDVVSSRGSVVRNNVVDQGKH